MDVMQIDLIHKECSKYYEDYKLMGSYKFFLPFYRVIMKMTYVCESKLNIIEQYICKCIERGINEKQQICEVLQLEGYIFDFTLSELECKNYLEIYDDKISFTEEGDKLYKRQIKLEEKVTNLNWYYDGLYPEFKNDFFSDEGNHNFLKYRDIEKKDDIVYITPKTIPNYDEKEDYKDLSYAAVKKFNSYDKEEKIVNVSAFEMMKDRNLLYHEYIIMIFKNDDNKFKLLAYDVCGNNGIDQRITKNLQKLYEEEKLTELMYSNNKEAINDMIFAIQNYNTQNILEYEEDIREVKEIIKNNKEAINTGKEVTNTNKEVIGTSKKIITTNKKNTKTKEKIIEINKETNNYNFNEEYLMNYEIREKFLYFLKNARESLYIISPWMNTYIINDEFLEDVDKLLKAGVKIRIKYGISSVDEIDKDKRNIRTSNLAEKLKELGKKYGDILKIEHGQTHEKLCICDRKYYINGSFNFLSYSGETRDGFRNEGSTYSENMLLINQVIKKRFGE